MNLNDLNITEAFVLKKDVVLIPVADLTDDMRGRISFDEGDYTLSHRHGRALAQVIDGETAALLTLFREPRTIVDAVVENSRALSKDPEAWLDELLPHLGKFLHNRVLVPVGAENDQEIRPQYESGAAIAGGWKVVRCASLIEDSEIYQLRREGEVAALKIARVTTPEMHSLFDNEAAILRHLDGSGIAPRLIDAGIHEERPYMIIDWIAGVDSSVAAAQRRHDRASLIDLCASIASTYAALHERGVLHGDVHQRNVFVGSSSECLGVPRSASEEGPNRGTPRNPEELRGTGEQVMLLDFGYSRLVDQPLLVGRAGVYSFFEPEYHAEMRKGVSLPTSAAGEQYAVAALLYLLIVDEHYLDFRYERDAMVEQVEAEPPRPFAQRDMPPWPEVEQILFRALEKDPQRRHGSMAEMAALLATARDTAVRESLATPVSEEANALLETTLQSFARGGAMFETRYPDPPRASINYGAAGAAAGLLRIAETRGDTVLLALANVWRWRAVALIGTDGAYYNAERELPREVLGDITPYHTESGIHAAAAMVSAAMGDPYSEAIAIRAFLEASNKPCAELDLTLGRSGNLLAAAMLLAIGDDLDENVALREFGSETMRAIWTELDARPPIAESLPPHTALGIAHGWTGYLYAALRWCAVSGDAIPPRLVERLHEFAAMKTPEGRGVYWRTGVDQPPSSIMPGWCNGSAGQVFLFTLAHRLLGDEQWLQLAELSAWNNWDEPRGVASLCCGSAGRAYALLNLYKHTGTTEWLSRARQLANHAAAHAVPSSQRTNALWKGELGVAVLIADLASPENARMPFFE